MVFALKRIFFISIIIKNYIDSRSVIVDDSLTDEYFFIIIFWGKMIPANFVQCKKVKKVNKNLMRFLDCRCFSVKPASNKIKI